ncbi:ABC transporter ATP-binding protein [Paenibacillus popilliae]|uniref:ATPase component n=1 Tax=Paenibacillus popilliae ATCC 14706 TaxID=1212764 RepID=M9M3N0_PAEPP|nr:ABC transporter ATP-binding protein [Paenibacillus popilliae]GAC41833.1 ATPase component [Paenibacillus popilliae ATCC 14706]
MQQLHLQHLEKKYKRNTVFSDINLQLTPGMFGLLGPNGAGKTTLMRIVAAIIRPTQGEICYHGLTWSTQPEQVREITGYLPQEFNVLPHFTALECMDYIAQLKGIGNKKIRRAEIAHLLERVNLQDQAERKVKTFSGGMRRRLGIAQALLGNPQILIIDEPTAGLDPEERIRFRNMIRELAWERIVILSTHIVEDISTTCRSAAILYQGTLRTFAHLEQLAALAQGQVWFWTLSHHDFRHATIQGDMISSKLFTDRVELRIWSEKQPNMDAVLIEPTIEEGYMACIKN